MVGLVAVSGGGDGGRAGSDGGAARSSHRERGFGAATEAAGLVGGGGGGGDGVLVRVRRRFLARGLRGLKSSAVDSSAGFGGGDRGIVMGSHDAPGSGLGPC